MRWPVLAALVLLGIVARGEAVDAHPHVFVEAKSEIVFDGSGHATGVRHAWRFDKFFSSYAILGYDHDQNGLLTPEELAELAEINAESLKDFDYYTFVYLNDEPVPIGDISGYWLSYDADMQQLTFYFVLTFAEPVDPSEGPLTIDIFDPEYFVAMEMTPAEPFAMIDAPKDCKLQREERGELDADTAAMLATIPREGEIPEGAKPLVKALSNTAIVRCGTARVTRR